MPTAEYLPRYGVPIRYGYVQGTFPLAAYQNVYAAQPVQASTATA